MQLGSMYPSKYLKADDLPPEGMLVEIQSLEIEEIGRDKSKKPVLYFADQTKGMVLNKTNAKAIGKLYGDDTDDWIGQSILLMSAQVDFQGDVVDAIRVRMPPPKKKKPAADPISTGPMKRVLPRNADLDDDIPF